MPNSEPRINVMDREEFQERVLKVFGQISSVLENSFGPYGANSFVSKHPDIYTTKDGFSIMKAIQFDDHIDNIIKDMIFAICARLNDAVGDGTTTATVMTAKLYDAYLEEYAEDLTEMNVSPRELLKAFQQVKDEIVTQLSEEATKIDFMNDPERATELIRSVVDIASNNDEHMTDLITSAYKDTNGSATIDVVLPETTETTIKKVDGYHARIVLRDRMYVDNDNNTMRGENGYVIILDHKLDLRFYKTVLKILAEKIRPMNKHLIVIAPFYDDMALQSTIAHELTAEFRTTRKAPCMVLTQMAMVNGMDRKRMSDLAMLLNTEIITEEIAKQLMKNMEANFSMDTVDQMFSFNGDRKNGDNDLIPLGISYKYELAINTESVFSDIRCDDEIYKIYLADAKHDYESIFERNKGLGTSTAEPFDAMKRYNALLMQSYRLAIGGESKLVQRYNKDVADDAVQAAKSAMENGVVLGCNVDTLSIITRVTNKTFDYENATRAEKLRLMVYEMLESAVSNVMEAIIGPALDGTILPPVTNALTQLKVMSSNGLNLTVDKAFLGDRNIGFTDDFEPIETTNIGNEFQFIKDVCLKNHCVFDPVKREFTRDIINSSRTDMEILTAAIDLVSLLISGNQIAVLDMFLRESK